MNPKVIGVSIGVLGLGVLVTFIILNKKASAGTPVNTPTGGSSSGGSTYTPPPAYVPPASKSSYSAPVAAPAAVPASEYRQNDPTKFIMGNDVFAAEATNLYDVPEFAVADIVQAVNPGANLGQFAGIQGTFVMVNSPTTGLSYVNINDTYQMNDVGT